MRVIGPNTNPNVTAKNPGVKVYHTKCDIRHTLKGGVNLRDSNAFYIRRKGPCRVLRGTQDSTLDSSGIEQCAIAALSISYRYRGVGGDSASDLTYR